VIGGKQFHLIGAVGLVALLTIVWSLLDWIKPASNAFPESATGNYRLIDSKSKICVGTWTSQGGRTVITLRDGKGISRLILQADEIEGGRMSIQDDNGQWHYYPSPPPE
jgi:hypothetical protein